MLAVIRKSQFKKDFKRLPSARCDLEVLKATVLKLAAGEELPESFRDHALIGNFRGFRECHLSGDWLLIYYRDAENLVLVRTGSHSELFG